MDIRRSIAGFIRNEDGASAPLEFVLLSVPVIIFSFCVVQVMLLAHAQIVIRGAAYAAARSAMVNACPPLSLGTSNTFGAMVQAQANPCSERSEKWKNAARVALMPISSANGKSKARQGGGCAFPQALSTIMITGGQVRNGIRESLENKACYAWEASNMAVAVEWQPSLGAVELGAGPPPIKATVQFRVPLLAPTRKIFHSGERGDNTFYWTGEQEVVLR